MLHYLLIGVPLMAYMGYKEQSSRWKNAFYFVSGVCLGVYLVIISIS